MSSSALIIFRWPDAVSGNMYYFVFRGRRFESRPRHKVSKLRFLMSFVILSSRPVYKKSTIFWDVTPCNLVEIFWRFGGTYSVCLPAASFSYLFSEPEDGDSMFLRNFRKLLPRYTASHPKTVGLFIVTAVTISALSCVYVSKYLRRCLIRFFFASELWCCVVLYRRFGGRFLRIYN
jgi:hypothetical protein